MASRKGKKNGESPEQDETWNKDDDVDALFKLPLMQFTLARNGLAGRLKKMGRSDEAQEVKSLTKPSISAWAVNQLYWRHRDLFERLIAAGESLGKAQASQLAGEITDIRGPMAERREALSGLSRLSAELLREAGHNPTPDTMRRITTTLEALSTGSSSSHAPRLGRLTDDIAAPGFDSLALFISSNAQPQRSSDSSRVVPFTPSARIAVSKREEQRKERIAKTKAALDSAERNVRETRSMAQDLVTALKDATAHADEMEKARRAAEERFEKARVAAEEARRRVEQMTAEAAKAARLLQDAERSFEEARQAFEEQTQREDSRNTQN